MNFEMPATWCCGQNNGQNKPTIDSQAGKCKLQMPWLAIDLMYKYVHIYIVCVA